MRCTDARPKRHGGGQWCKASTAGDGASMSADGFRPWCAARWSGGLLLLSSHKQENCQPRADRQVTDRTLRTAGEVGRCWWRSWTLKPAPDPSGWVQRLCDLHRRFRGLDRQRPVPRIVCMARLKAFKVRTPYPKRGETGRKLGMSKSEVAVVGALVAKTKPKASKRSGVRAASHVSARRASR